jgi:hypothetical protein
LRLRRRPPLLPPLLARPAAGGDDDPWTLRDIKPEREGSGTGQSEFVTPLHSPHERAVPFFSDDKQLDASLPLVDHFFWLPYDVLLDACMTFERNKQYDV